MTLLTLQRIHLPDATVGVLTMGTRRWATLEDRGPGEVPDTCVPPALYDLVPHSGPKYPDTYALVGGIVSHLPEPGKKRSAVLVHWGNVVEDTLGCILIGNSLTLQTSGAPAVFNSRLAFSDWLAMMKSNPGPHRLHIT